MPSNTERDNAAPLTDEQRIDLAAARILAQYKKAFEELAK